MPEEFIQFIWEQRLYDPGKLTTTKGEPVEVLDPGSRNSDSGPDFFNARIRIGETLWAGNVEIHRLSSDWNRHHHAGDNAYDNIILHVVLQNDLPVKRANGEEVPTLELTWPEYLTANYRQLLAARTWIPCQQQFHHIDFFVLRIGFNRLMIERLQDKTTEITVRLAQNNFDWNETFYQFLARNFGFKTNAAPFELLARGIPLVTLGKHRGNLKQTEALLFGQAGLLHGELLGDDYFLELRKEYDHLAHKYGLRPGEAHLWKFLRLRPVNFPTIRIAQLAALVNQAEGLFSRLIETTSPTEAFGLFDVQPSPYWEHHYKFNYSSRPIVKKLGASAIHNLMINTVVPFMFVYGETTSHNQLKDRALEWLEALPAEENGVISKWEALGVAPRSAFETQALLQLKNRYCAAKKCLKCHVGNKLIKASNNTSD